MIKKLSFLLIFFQFSSLFAQTENTIEDAWVYFTDKPQASYFINNPTLILSQRALDRRSRQNILVDALDVPVDENYLNQINNANVQIKAKSKWLNAIHVQGTQTNILALTSLNFVNRIEFANRSLNNSSRSLISDSNSTPDTNVSVPKFNFVNYRSTETSFNYGNTAIQNQMIKVDYLHQNNYTGNNMHIAVIDAGFPSVNTIGGFNRIRSNNKIKSTYNYVTAQENVYTGNWHGTSVLSIISGFINNSYVGAAPDANLHLFVTESDNYEGPLEESWWVQAVEKSDSLGVDVVNSSLGYRVFDNVSYNYTPSNMNGQTSFIARGGSIALSRGMIVVNSNGNYRQSEWNIMGTPADNVNVFSVGAVDRNRTIGNFSSPGPTADNRIKPDVAAMGAKAKAIYTDNRVYELDGTSFSAPLITGAIACFWEAFPNKTAIEILELVKKSAHLYQNPNYDMGYGIPNFELAFNQTLNVTNLIDTNKITIFPNPFINSIQVNLPKDKTQAQLSIYNNFGQNVLNSVIYQNQLLNLENLSSGIYLYKIKIDQNEFSGKLIKR